MMSFIENTIIFQCTQIQLGLYLPFNITTYIVKRLAYIYAHTIC